LRLVMLVEPGAPLLGVPRVEHGGDARTKKARGAGGAFVHLPTDRSGLAAHPSALGRLRPTCAPMPSREPHCTTRTAYSASAGACKLSALWAKSFVDS